jgi:hypothetical protein
MDRGHILDFSNQTFSDFVIDSIGRDPSDAVRPWRRSNANRLHQLEGASV